jgi:predicted esterase
VDLRWSALVVAPSLVLAACRGRASDDGTNAAASSRHAVTQEPPAAQSMPAPMPEPPRRVRRDSVPAGIASATAGEGWVMHESAPLIEPDAEPRPVTVLFHAICADDNWTCDWLQYFAMAPQWQLCPRAPVACSGGGYQWTASAGVMRKLVEESVVTTKARHGDLVREDATVLAGFSQGSYAVAALTHDLATRPGSPLRVKGVLVQGAGVHFVPADVRQLGLRVALVAGDLDAASPAMRAEADRLVRAGVEARYVSLGKDEGHFISVSTGKTVAQALDWCRGP